jgi:hypothetical protein
VPPIDRLWQELQEIKPDFDKRVSKNNFLPSSAMAGLATLAGLIAEIGSLLGASACTNEYIGSPINKATPKTVKRFNMTNTPSICRKNHFDGVMLRFLGFSLLTKIKNSLIRAAMTTIDFSNNHKAL